MSSNSISRPFWMAIYHSWSLFLDFVFIGTDFDALETTKKQHNLRSSTGKELHKNLKKIYHRSYLKNNGNSVNKNEKKRGVCVCRMVCFVSPDQVWSLKFWLNLSIDVDEFKTFIVKHH